MIIFKNMLRYYIITFIVIIFSIDTVFASELIGKITGIKGDEFYVEMSSKELPRKGDPVTILLEIEGDEYEAGTAEIIESKNSRVTAIIKDGTPSIDMKVMIQTEEPLIEEPVVVKQEQSDNNTSRIPDDSSNDDGWGGGKVAPKNPYIGEIVAANEACDYHRSLFLADKARSEGFSNSWLEHNYETIRTIARRAVNYKKALNNALHSLEKEQIGQSVQYLKQAMQNASVQCGQDRQVLSLIDQAKQIASIERDEAIERARQRSYQNKHDSQQYRAEIEKKRASRKAFGQALNGNLLGILKTLNAPDAPKESKSPPPPGW